MSKYKSNNYAFVTFLVTVLAFPVLSFAQADMDPVNDLPNPYSTQAGFFKMPAGRNWGSSSTVDLDPDGESIWIAERCGGNIGFCTANP